MATDLIRYDLRVQEALRGVVREVLSEAARNGLQGDHHFFSTFTTNAPGLRLSNVMRERYPDEMTIILQHQFWDLGVTQHAFEVGLSFSNRPERLLVPFAAITSFVDPSVQFGLKFDVQDGGQAGAPASGEVFEPSEAGKPKRVSGAADPKVPALVKSEADASVAESRKSEPAGKLTLAKAAEGDAPKGEGETKVVSIDAFRKKP